MIVLDGLSRSRGIIIIILIGMRLLILFYAAQDVDQLAKAVDRPHPGGKVSTALDRCSRPRSQSLRCSCAHITILSFSLSIHLSVSVVIPLFADDSDADKNANRLRTKSTPTSPHHVQGKLHGQQLPAVRQGGLPHRQDRTTQGLQLLPLGVLSLCRMLLKTDLEELLQQPIKQ